MLVAETLPFRKGLSKTEGYPALVKLLHYFLHHSVPPGFRFIIHYSLSKDTLIKWYELMRAQALSKKYRNGVYFLPT